MSYVSLTCASLSRVPSPLAGLQPRNFSLFSLLTTSALLRDPSYKPQKWTKSKSGPQNGRIVLPRSAHLQVGREPTLEGRQHLHTQRKSILKDRSLNIWVRGRIPNQLVTKPELDSKFFELHSSPSILTHTKIKFIWSSFALVGTVKQMLVLTLVLTVLRSSLTRTTNVITGACHKGEIFRALELIIYQTVGWNSIP